MKYQHGPFHRKANTDKLLRYLAEGRVCIDIETGTVLKRDGTPFYIRVNGNGYKRFKVKESGRTTWFFVHKAVWLSANPEPIRFPYVIDHVNRDRMDCRLVNLRLVHIATNAKNRSDCEPAF